MIIVLVKLDILGLLKGKELKANDAINSRKMLMHYEDQASCVQKEFLYRFDVTLLQ